VGHFFLVNFRVLSQVSRVSYEFMKSCVSGLTPSCPSFNAVQNASVFQEIYDILMSVLHSNAF